MNRRVKYRDILCFSSIFARWNYWNLYNKILISISNIRPKSISNRGSNRNQNNRNARPANNRKQNNRNNFGQRNKGGSNKPKRKNNRPSKKQNANPIPVITITLVFVSAVTKAGCSTPTKVILMPQNRLQECSMHLGLYLPIPFPIEKPEGLL